MRAKLSYKSKRNIVIALIIMILFAASVTTTYFYMKGNQDSSAAFTGNESQTSEITPVQGSTEGEQTSPEENGEVVVPNVNDNNEENATTTPEENQTTTRPNTQIGQNGVTGNGTATTTQTTGNVPNQEYVTERTEQETVLVSENYAVAWAPLAINADTTTSGRSIVRPEITAAKTADKQEVKVGEELVYTITATNSGKEDGIAVITDNVPAGTTFVEESIKVNDKDTTYTAEDLAKGISVEVAKNNGTAKVSFKVVVNENTEEVISNIAYVNGKPTEPVNTNADTTTNYIVKYYYEKLSYTNIDDKYVHLDTDYQSAKIKDIITTYTDKLLPGYEFEKVTPADENGSLSLKITANEENNIINVYYVRKSYSYKIEYYKDSLEGEKIKTETSSTTEKLGTIIDADTLGQNIINKYKPTGYQNGNVQENLIITSKEDNNVIRIVYLPRNDIDYTVKYYFNNIEEKDKMYTEKATFGTKVSNVTDYSNNGEWTLNAAKTNLPYEIKKVSGNIIEVYYEKPDIKVTKTPSVKGTVKYNDEITYTIEATNSGSEGKVKIGDTVPVGTELVSITATGYETISEEELKTGIELTVPANGTARIELTVKVTAGPGATITNIPTVDGKVDTDNTVTNKVEGEAVLRSNEQKLVGYNVVFVLDKSGSMRDTRIPSDELCTLNHDHTKDNRCVKDTDGKWYTAAKRSRLKEAQEVIKGLIGKLKFPIKREDPGAAMTIVSFAKNATVEGTAYNSGKANTLKNSVDNIKPSGAEAAYTIMSTALEKAKTELRTLAKNKPDNKNIVIFVSDGQPSEEDDIATIKANADALKKVKNTTVYTVAFGENIPILQYIASDKDKCYTTSATNGLEDIISKTMENLILEEGREVSDNGKIEIKDIDTTKPVTITVNGNKETVSLPDAQKRIVTINGKTYLDLTKFAPEAKITLDYMLKK